MSDEHAEPIDPPPSAHRVPDGEKREQITIDATPENRDAPADATIATPDASPEPAAPAPTPRKSRKGWLFACSALILGGGGWYGLQSAGSLPGVLENTPSPEVSKAPDVPAAPPSPAKQVAEPSPAAMPAVSPSGFDAFEKAANERFDRLEAGLTALQQAAKPVPVVDPQIDERLKKLEAAASSPTAGPATDAAPIDLQPLETRLSKLEAAIPPAGEAPPALVTPAPPIDLQPIEGRLNALERHLQTMEDNAKAAKTEVRATEPAAATAPRKPDPIAQAVVAQTMGRAVDSGAPFPAAFAAAKALGAPPELLAPLERLADKGGVDNASLAKLFSDSETAVLAAAQPPLPDDASAMDRLAALASKAVRVRPAATTDGNDPPALVARVEGALARGAVGEAFNAWNALPPASKNASRAFGDAAGARVGAEKAVAALTALAVDEIANSGDKK